jgi:GGDEF domain-containing protein
MTALLDRRHATPTAISAAVVIGLEPGCREVSLAALAAVAERLERSVRPWDLVVPIGPGVIGVLCAGLTCEREVEAVATRLADAVRAPIAVGEEIYQLGACHGASVAVGEDDRNDAFTRAQDAMHQMRATRALLLGDDDRGAGASA